MNTKTIKFDLNKYKLYEKIKAKQGDTKSRFLLFQLLDRSVPFNLKNRSVRAYMIKPDGKEIFNDLIVNNYNLGYCTLELTNQVLAVPGTVKIELMVTEEEKKLTSSVFEVEVVKSINSEKSIVSTNEFTALLNGLAALSEYDNYKNAVKEMEINKADKAKVEEKFGEVYEQLDTKANIEYVDNKISKVASGSPKGIYSTLNELNIAKPTGDTGIYITTDNGCWNYWNGNAWVSGGIYQGVKIDYNSISQKHLTFPAIQGKERINLYNKDSVVKGSYVDRNNGNISENEEYSYCEYFEILPGMNYICNAADNGEQLAFYDSNKIYISGLLLKDNNQFVTPSNAEYVRITVKITNIAQFMFVMGTELPSEYKPFVKPTSLYFEDSLNELEKAIFKSGLSENLRREKINYFNKAKAIQGYYIERTDGTAKANENY